MTSTLLPLTCQKSEFSLPDGHCYLNSAFMGPLPHRVEQAGLQALRERVAPTAMGPTDFFAPAERVRELCAQLVNADPEQVAFVPTVAYATAIVAKNTRVRSGQNVLLLGDLFSSNVYAWRNWRASGVEMRTISAPVETSLTPACTRAALWNDQVIDAIDKQTVLVAVEQAHWTDGTLFDLERIGARCREVGAALVIDATQTVGAMPLDVQRIRPDLLVVHSYKAMLANYGLGFAVFSERFLDASPLEESWLMRAGSEDFARLVDYEDRYAAGMRRFDTSLRANPILIRMLEAACQLLIEWEPARIRDYLYEIARRPLARLREAGFAVAAERERCANLFGIRLPEGLAPEQCRQMLKRNNIHVSVRGNAVRVSPHVYNDEQDLDRLVDVLLPLVSSSVC